MTDPSEFLYPRSRYRGQWSQQNLVFNANLQEFAQRTSPNFSHNFYAQGKSYFLTV